MKKASQPERSQLAEWQRKRENHEQVAMGKKSERQKDRERRQKKAEEKQGR